MRVMRAAWHRRGIVILGATIGLLLLPAAADSHGGQPPEDRGNCPSQDETVVIRGGKAYRWVDFAGPEARLVSYQFKDGTFPPDPLTWEPTYPQLKFDIDWGWGCLSVHIPKCGQVDTTVIGFNPPGTLRYEDAVAAIAGGNVLAGDALVGSADDCTCPDLPAAAASAATADPLFTGQNGRPGDPQPCHGND